MAWPLLFIPVGFARGLVDRDLGLTRFGGRDYDPLVGRFTAPDPLGDTGGDHDLYDYCVDDPVNYKDTSGLFTMPGNQSTKHAPAGSPEDLLNKIGEDLKWYEDNFQPKHQPIGPDDIDKRLNSLEAEMGGSLTLADRTRIRGYRQRSNYLRKKYDPANR